MRSKRSGHLRRSDRALQLSTRSRASREARRSIQKVNCFHREAERHSSRLNAPNEETALRVCGFMGSLVIPSAFANFELLLLRGRGSFPGPRYKFLPRTPAAPQPASFRFRRRVPSGSPPGRVRRCSVGKPSQPDVVDQSQKHESGQDIRSAVAH